MVCFDLWERETWLMATYIYGLKGHMSLCVLSLAKSKYELKVDSTIHPINCYAVDEYFEIQLCHPMDSNLSSE